MSQSNSPAIPVALVVHCDWGGDAKKRWMANARWNGRRFVASAPTLVGDTATFLPRIRSEIDEDDRVLVGFDFPIGLPSKYAKELGITDFLTVLPILGLDLANSRCCFFGRA